MQAQEPQKEEFVGRNLFGGALQCYTPKRFTDVSAFRQVPDNQEVFSDINTDQSIIIELLSMEEVPNEETAMHHFKELARDNDALDDCAVLKVERLGKDDVPNLGDDAFKSILIGQQRIAKFNEQAKNTVTIVMAVIRLPNVTTDVIITLNDPTQIAAGSSSAQSIDPLGSHQVNSSLMVMKVLLKSFDVRDWSLFGSD